MRAVPLLVNGALDTKTNPKLVQAPALLELYNMYQILTGELTPRNGFTRQTATAAITSATNLFVTQNGGLGSVARGLASVAFPRAVKYGAAGWGSSSGRSNQAYPVYSAAVAGVQPYVGSNTGTAPDAVDIDMCLTAALRAAVWTDGAAAILIDQRELTTGITSSLNASTPLITSGRSVKIASTGGNWMAIFGSQVNNLTATAHSSGTFTATHTIATDIDAASPWFDIKAIPGTNNFAVAWKVTAAGGVKCAIYNPSTGAVTAVVTTAAADASFCMGWLDDSFTTGNMYLATVGSVAGVVVRTMAAGTMVVSATNVIDATATANVRNVTGHLFTGATNYTVFWDVSGASQIYDTVKRGRWTGSAAVTTFIANHSIYSRSTRFPDGTYYMAVCFASTVQPTLALAFCDTTSTSPQSLQCYVMSGEGGPRRGQSFPATAVVSGSSVLVPMIRTRKITTPTGGTAAQARVPVIATFSQITKLTHARELGSTVFLPGGSIQRDDGAAITTATFPIYPEAPTGTSAAAGAMTASGAYLYRAVLRTVDSAGRTCRSAASVQFAITLGAGDGTVNLALFNLKVPPGDFDLGVLPGFGRMYTEIYRRGPAASGATLYNKVGEVAMNPAGGDTVAFADTMSDANAALGEAAYFNGNVLENFHPPATNLLEVNGNRVGLVNAEDPTEFWFSKEYKAGTGIAFNPLLKVQISGDGAGGMTGLAAMDGNWILFKKSAIYVLSGDGPNDLGQGSFNQPRAVSRTVGTTNPSSIIETPDGIMFQAADGRIWLLDRGMGLSYIGAPVEGFTVATLIAGAAQVSTLPTVRFVTQTGRMLEYDYYHKRWYIHQLLTGGHSIVDCANSTVFGWCYILDNGELYKEIANQGRDTAGAVNTPIYPQISFPHIQLAGLAGYQRLHAIEFTIGVLGAHTLSVDAEYDFSGGVTGTPKTIVITGGAATEQIEYNPPEGLAKCTSVRPVITVSDSFPPTGATFTLTSATAYVGTKRGTNVGPSKRMT